MRKMTETEINELVKNSNWATICTVTPEGFPYAIEATYFIDGEYIGFMINPRGSTIQNLAYNTNLLLKITRANSDLSQWSGVSLFGIGHQVDEACEIIKGWNLLSKVTGTDYSIVAAKFTEPQKASPYLRCRITKRTGRCNR